MYILNFLQWCVSLSQSNYLVIYLCSSINYKQKSDKTKPETFLTIIFCVICCFPKLCLKTFWASQSLIRQQVPSSIIITGSVFLTYHIYSLTLILLKKSHYMHSFFAEFLSNFFCTFQQCPEAILGVFNLSHTLRIQFSAILKVQKISQIHFCTIFFMFRNTQYLNRIFFKIFVFFFTERASAVCRRIYNYRSVKF